MCPHYGIAVVNAFRCEDAAVSVVWYRVMLSCCACVVHLLALDGGSESELTVPCPQSQ